MEKSHDSQNITESVPPTFKFSGVVKFIELEGGFYGIIGDNGINYNPVNLPKEFQENFLKVEGEASVFDGMSFHMWGKLIQIENILKHSN